MNTTTDLPRGLTDVNARHLDALESEAIHIMREVAAECANPALLFSGGKDSVVLLRIATRTKDRFTGDHWEPGPEGVPVLRDVAGWLVGRISMRLSFENNAVVVAEVVAASIGPDGAPLLYHGGSYGTPTATDYVI